jgi:SOS-response transcriptional repressor LexA
MDAIEFGGLIKRIRKAKKLGQKEVKPQGKSISWFSRLEGGEIPDVSVQDLVEMASNLQVHPSELLAGFPVDFAMPEKPPMPPRPEVDERMRHLAEIGEKVMEVVRQSPLHIVPSELVEPAEDEDEETIEVPVYAAFAADRLQLSERQVEERMRVPKRLWLTASDPLLILITGNCLMRKGIIRGDYVVVDASKVEPRTGDLVAFRFQGNESVKVFRRDGETIHLEPTVDEYDAIVVRPGQESDLEIVGVVTAWWDYAPRV